MNTQPLVSIIVITYNSARHVLETLESARVQTYNNIELIITDDCSTDNTVSVCKKWLEDNSDRFFRIELVTTPVNTGTPANCNRGLKAAQGEWLKYIAGDDALLDICIEENLKYSTTNTDVSCIHSDCEQYEDNFAPENFMGNFKTSHKRFSQSDITAKEQHHLLLTRSPGVSAPTVFVKRAVIISVGGFDERMSLLEDTPLWINLTQAGNKIHYLELATAKYRMHSSSVQRIGKPHMSTKFANELIRFDRIYKKGRVNLFVYGKRLAILKLIVALNKANLNNNSLFSRISFKILDKILKIT